MCKIHRDASTNASYWLFWILDSYKAFQLHAWRCDQHPERFTRESSLQWVRRNGALRSAGKLSIIREDINCELLREVYRDVFDLEKSIWMTLCPEESTDEERDAATSLLGEEEGRLVGGGLETRDKECTVEVEVAA
jgi:hypothetical protein